VEPEIAHRIATQNHGGQRNRFGDRVIDHLERVAAAAPPDARAAALLHDLLELCLTVRRRLRSSGLTSTELEALELLTHVPDQPYELYVRRIAAAAGPAGRLARIVKLADLEDHLVHASIPSDAPPYAWARQQLLSARDRAGQAAPRTPSQTRGPPTRRSRRASDSPSS
jgi:hypothetical protein